MLFLIGNSKVFRVVWVFVLIVIIYIFIIVKANEARAEYKTFAEYVYKDKAYPALKYYLMPKVESSFLFQYFLRNVYRFAIPLASGSFIIYDLYKQYNLWKQYTETEIQTQDVVKYVNCYNGGKITVGISCTTVLQKPYLESYAIKTSIDPSRCIFSSIFERVGYTIGSTNETSSLRCCAYASTPNANASDMLCSTTRKLAIPPLLIYVYPTSSAQDSVSVSLKESIDDIINAIDSQSPFVQVMPYEDSAISSDVVPLPSDYIVVKVEDESGNLTSIPYPISSPISPISNTTTSISDSSGGGSGSSGGSSSSGNSSDFGNYSLTDITDILSNKVDDSILSTLLERLRSLLGFLPVPRIVASGGECRVPVNIALFGISRESVLDFCSFDSVFRSIGNIFVMMSVFYSVYILYRNS
jgi:uncharacterized membrane protein YgcG